MTTLYKVLDPDRMPRNGGTGQWLPPGEWMPAIDDIAPCRRGYHVCRGASDLLHWLGPEVWEVEVRGDVIRDEHKLCVSEARLVRRVETWNDCTARLFAADCAARVLHLFERSYPGDTRTRGAIVAARAFARGEIDDAARAAADDAAWAAAWPTVDAAWDAAMYAARSAARAAADAAARAAACDAFAACDAARDAAGTTTWPAARSAAWDAAWTTTWSAEERWQARRLAQYLRGAVRHDTPLPVLEGKS